MKHVIYSRRRCCKRFRLDLLAASILVLATVTASHAQQSDRPIRIFGYFQTNYVQLDEKDVENHDATSFALQQLNLFCQKDLDRNLTAFVNLEFLNNYSSSHQWGSFSVEEAWVRYRAARQFSLRVGLQTPTFNYLNDIKNRTPLLAYVVRPLVYESSFNEIIRLEEYLPARAYIQAFGSIPKGASKFDYAAYVGNSPNINNDPRNGQTGVDTTTSFLVGGRAGYRCKELSLGVSATYDRYHVPTRVAQLLEDKSVTLSFPRTRFGADLRYTLWKLSLESEFIQVKYNNRLGGFDIDLQFYYGTLFFDVTDRIKVYGSYWYAKERFFQLEETQGIFGEIDTVAVDLDYSIEVPNVGAAYTLTDKIVIKVHVAPVRQEYKFSKSVQVFKFNYFAAAVSVFL